VHDVFHASLLKPYVRGANVQPPPMPTVVNGEECFEVDQILNHRDRKIHVRKATKHTLKEFKLQREYLVKWRGYSDDHNTWEPASMVAARCSHRVVSLQDTNPQSCGFKEKLGQLLLSSTRS